MIRQFFLYSKQYSTKGAFGFYLAHLLAVVLFGVATMMVYIAITGNTNETSLLRFGTGISVLSSLYISFRILEAKKKLKNTQYILIACVSGLCALFGGSILGLIPAALLSTKE